MTLPRPALPAGESLDGPISGPVAGRVAGRVAGVPSGGGRDGRDVVGRPVGGGLAPADHVGLGTLAARTAFPLPAVFAVLGDETGDALRELLYAGIDNVHTRAAYTNALNQLCAWCTRRGLRSVLDLDPILGRQYAEHLKATKSIGSVKVHLAALRRVWDALMQKPTAIRSNPWRGVKGPKLVRLKGSTPTIERDDVGALFASIDTRTLAGLRDRALLGVLLYSFARISAALGMAVEDYAPKRGTLRAMEFRLLEKGGKRHEVPAHHQAIEYVDAYLTAAGVLDAEGRVRRETAKWPLFRALNRDGTISDRALTRQRAWEMIKRRCRAAGLPEDITCHSCRATGITAAIENGMPRERAQAMAAHADARTTALYDRSDDAIHREEVELISFAPLDRRRHRGAFVDA